MSVLGWRGPDCSNAALRRTPAAWTLGEINFRFNRGAVPEDICSGVTGSLRSCPPGDHCVVVGQLLGQGGEAAAAHRAGRRLRRLRADLLRLGAQRPLLSATAAG
ncbi:hypothetical protein GCM10009616_16030 [Microlunatus lacustris]